MQDKFDKFEWCQDEELCGILCMNLSQYFLRINVTLHVFMYMKMREEIDHMSSNIIAFVGNTSKLTNLIQPPLKN